MKKWLWHAWTVWVSRAHVYYQRNHLRWWQQYTEAMKDGTGQHSEIFMERLWFWLAQRLRFRKRFDAGRAWAIEDEGKIE